MLGHYLAEISTFSERRKRSPTSRDSARTLAYLKSYFLSDAGVGPGIALMSRRLPQVADLLMQGLKCSSWPATTRTDHLEFEAASDGLWSLAELGASRQQAIVQHKLKEDVEWKGGARKVTRMGSGGSVTELSRPEISSWYGTYRAAWH